MGSWLFRTERLGAVGNIILNTSDKDTKMVMDGLVSNSSDSSLSHSDLDVTLTLGLKLSIILQ